MTDISTDTGKLAAALWKTFYSLAEVQHQATQTARLLERMGNSVLADRFRRAAGFFQRADASPTISYLQPVGSCIHVALSQAVNGFRHREHRSPTWAAAGEGATLPEHTMRHLGLHPRADIAVRPGHILVGRDEEGD